MPQIIKSPDSDFLLVHWADRCRAKVETDVVGD